MIGHSWQRSTFPMSGDFKLTFVTPSTSTTTTGATLTAAQFGAQANAFCASATAARQAIKVSETAYYIASLKLERNLYAKLASLHPSPAFAADVVSYLSSAVKGELDQEAVILATPTSSRPYKSSARYTCSQQRNSRSTEPQQKRSGQGSPLQPAPPSNTPGP